MKPAELEHAVFELVVAPGYRPVKPRVIAKRLGLADDDDRRLRTVIKKLVRAGKLEYGAGHLVRPPSPTSADQLIGVFRRMERGFGFVRPAGISARRDRTADVYVAAERAADASTGDLVRVQLLGRGRKQGAKREGAILEIIERETRQFVGTYFAEGRAGFVQVDGTVFAQPIAVGDPGAKGARDDDKVVIEMVRFPAHAHAGEGVITEVLGPRGEPGVDTLTIIREYELPEEFDDASVEEARAQAGAFDPTDLSARKDLTDLTVVTIDPVSARDFDDAISLDEDDDGGWRLGVHIADVSHFVREGGPLDREAYRRGTSVYLPDRVLPMLPEVISNNLASLQPNKVRFAKTVFVDFAADGKRLGAETHSAAIKSNRRFTYEEVDDYLENPRRWQRKLPAKVHALLGRMHRLAMILRKRRARRGALELNLPEVEINLDDLGRVSGAHLVEYTESHQIIEEFMLAANEAVADLLHRRGVPFLRRVHDAPDPLKLQELTKFVTALGIKTESLESRFAIQQLLARVEGRPEQHAVHYALLRSLRRAEYRPDEEGHFALASDCYCHFTSPIRRYPDLTVHRLLDVRPRRKKPPSAGALGQLAIVGEHCSERERLAEDAERDVIKLKLLGYLHDRIGEQMDAVVTGVTEFGLFAQGIELPAEGMVHISSLADDYYDFDRISHTLRGRRGALYRLGDPVRVEVVRVDLTRRELDLRVVEHGRPQAATRRGSRAAKGRQRKARAAGGGQSAKRPRQKRRRKS